LRKETDYRALIVASGPAPKSIKALQKNFLQKYRITLFIHTGVKKNASVDLRPFLKRP